MTCGCAKTHSTVLVESNGCRFSCPGNTWWRQNVSCYAWRCYNQLMLSDPPEWAYAYSRKATVGDTAKGEILEEADYIVVRSCFCRKEKCPHYIENNSTSENETYN